MSQSAVASKQDFVNARRIAMIRFPPLLSYSRIGTFKPVAEMAAHLFGPSRRGRIGKL
jgi:hypothetical protein